MSTSCKTRSALSCKEITESCCKETLACIKDKSCSDFCQKLDKLNLDTPFKKSAIELCTEKPPTYEKVVHFSFF